MDAEKNPHGVRIFPRRRALLARSSPDNLRSGGGDAGKPKWSGCCPVPVDIEAETPIMVTKERVETVLSPAALRDAMPDFGTLRAG